MPPPVDAEGQAIGVPISGMNLPGLFNRFQMPGVLNALAQRQRMDHLGLLETYAKAIAAKHILSDAGGLNIKALWKDSPPGHRENSSSTHSAFMLGT